MIYIFIRCLCIYLLPMNIEVKIRLEASFRFVIKVPMSFSTYASLEPFCSNATVWLHLKESKIINACSIINLQLESNLSVQCKALIQKLQFPSSRRSKKKTGYLSSVSSAIGRFSTKIKPKSMSGSVPHPSHPFHRLPEDKPINIH